MDIKQRVDKRMLILCTSFKQIEAFKYILNKNKIENVLCQNSSSSKERLLKQYISNNKSILFGTNSFWEGINLPEDLLEVLIILNHILVFHIQESNDSEMYCMLILKSDYDLDAGHYFDV